MKKIIYLIIAIITTYNSEAQIFDITERNGKCLTGAYYKDTQNLLNQFVGTYIYTNGTTSFKIVLQKKEMSSVNNRYHEDLIIGEYQYIKDGVEKANTLNNLTINYANGWKYNINGNRILTGTYLGCSECGATEKRLRAGLVDESTNNWAELDIRKVMVNGQPAIKIFISWQMQVHLPGAPPLLKPSFPGLDYTLIKQ